VNAQVPDRPSSCYRVAHGRPWGEGQVTFRGRGSEQNTTSRTIMSMNSSRSSKTFCRRRRETKGEGLKTRHYQFRIGWKRDKQTVREGCKRTSLMSLSADYIRDREKRRKVNDHCAKLWSAAGNVHGEVFKREGKVLRRYKAHQRFPNHTMSHYFATT
jgi:hypothetical protein